MFTLNCYKKSYVESRKSYVESRKTNILLYIENKAREDLFQHNNIDYFEVKR